MYRLHKLNVLFDEAAANGWSKEENVYDYRHVLIVVSTSDSADMTLKVAGSILEQASIDFTSAAAVDNEWNYLALYNYEDAAITAGTTGIVYSGADSVKTYMVNIDAMKTLAVELSGYSAGKATVKLFGVTNQ